MSKVILTPRELDRLIWIVKKAGSKGARFAKRKDLRQKLEEAKDAT
jgi:hypothetical protein